jgi:hypothetical protein
MQKMKRISLRLSAMLFAASMVAGCATRPLTPDFYGAPANASTAERTILIGPNTRYVNVQDGQIVAFNTGGKTFAWHFMAASGVRSMRLNDIAPPGLLDHEVTAYLSPDPRYIGGGDRDR